VDITLPLSILDLSIGRTGRPLHTSLRETVTAAQLADRLGFRRFWVGENHNIASLASSAPAALIATIAESTERINVGAGCLLLNNHPPLAVAETFRVLHALHPGRIDLGVGRAPGGDPLATLALRRERSMPHEDEFLDRLAELFGFTDGLPAGHPYHGVVAMPHDVALPPVWVLGAGTQSARIAALAGVRYGYAGHLVPTLELAREPITVYRAAFEPTGSAPAAAVALSVQVFCSETQRRAEDLADAYAVAWNRHLTGRTGLVPTVEEARAARGEAGLGETRRLIRGTARVGTPDTVVQSLLTTAADLGVDEIILTTGIHDPDERAWCYELIAKQWAATGRANPAGGIH
jgi:luciferase family oxidoreductase group 1